MFADASQGNAPLLVGDGGADGGAAPSPPWIRRGHRVRWPHAASASRESMAGRIMWVLENGGGNGRVTVVVPQSSVCHTMLSGLMRLTSVLIA